VPISDTANEHDGKLQSIINKLKKNAEQAHNLEVGYLSEEKS
jgi:hypothetical protein